MPMTGRERLAATLAHRAPDRIPVDFNGTAVTGMHVKCVIGLRRHYGLEERLVKVHEPYQMLGWLDDDLQTVLGIDVEGAYGPTTMFGYRNENWAPWRMDDGTEVLMSGNFVTTKDANGDTLRFKIQGRPGWAAFDSATGTLSGTPGHTHIGLAQFTVRDTDAAGAFDEALLEITV